MLTSIKLSVLTGSPVWSGRLSKPPTMDGVSRLPVPGNHFNKIAVIQLQHIHADAPAIGDEFVARVHWRRQLEPQNPPLA